MDASFVAYIDESGDEGFEFGRGSSDWFVLAAVVTSRAADASLVQLVSDVKTRLGRPPKQTLHFRDLRHEHRLVYVAAIADTGVTITSVLAHKPSIVSPGKYHKGHSLYFTSLRYALERVSWCCNEAAAVAGDGSVELVLSNRGEMSCDDVRERLRSLRHGHAATNVRIDWTVVREDQVSIFSPGRRAGLQIADAAATAWYYGVQPSQYGFTEGRYVRMLDRVIYRHAGRRLSYGAVLWPRELAPLLDEEEYGWLRQ